MSSNQTENRLAKIQADQTTRQFQDEALAQLDDLLENPPIHGEIVENASGDEYQVVSKNAHELLNKNGFLSLLLALANFAENVYRYLHFGYAQPGETEEEADNRERLKNALLVAIADGDHTISEYYAVVFNANNRFPNWKVFPDAENREEQIISARCIVEFWQALVFPNDVYPQDTMLTQGQRDFLQAQLWDMEEAGVAVTNSRFSKIDEPAIEARLVFLQWMLENNRAIPKVNLAETRMLYTEVLAKAQQIVQSTK